MSPMLHLHRAERADRLVAALADLMTVPLDDPLAPEVVSVPTRGMERWITQRASERLGARDGRRDGVCANVAFPPPRALVGAAVAAASGVAEDEDPWVPERLVWPLLRVVDAALGEPWLRPLAHHLGADDARDDPIRRARRLATVRHLAELYDRYAVQRPELLRGWAAGEDADGWQAELWRRVRAELPVPDLASRLPGACARLREEPELAALPARLSLFGLTRLPPVHRDVLAALAHARDVHLFLLHPSPVLWERVAQIAHDRERVVRRAADPTAVAAENRLLASWGRDARELQLVVGGGDADVHHPAPEVPPATLLERIQADVRADRVPPGEPLPDEADARAPLAPGDRSVRVHACHGRARQVEVVRDQILHLLADDRTLEPRDVIVMCPDIETFAPLVHATFGAGEVRADDDLEDEALPPGLRPPDLRVRLADRSLRQTNPVLGAVAALLELADARLTASQVLDFADREPVRRRFRLDDDDLARIVDWIGESAIRWGLDASHRAPFRLEAVGAGTWRAGLDRVLLGVTMTEDGSRLVDGVLPLDDVESGSIDLAGRFAELVERLRVAVHELGREQDVAGWADALAAAADALTGPAPRDAWQRAELQRVLDAVVEEADGDATPLALGEVRALLADRLQGRPTRANFRTGHLTVCTLVPMRSVPHRVVCLLGLDDGAFPRKAPRDGDDLLLGDPHVGDRDPRHEDRQLLLDALMAATDRLVVTYTGNDERTNAPRPPAVPVGELLDVVDRTVRVEGGRRARDVVLRRHPLQPFDPENFRAARPWSFDRASLDGAVALAGPRTQPPPFLAGALPAPDTSLLDVDELVRFVQHPVRAFLRRRLGLSLGDWSDEVEDALPVELDGLGRWAIGDRMLRARLAGCDRRAAYRAEIARGKLPPGKLGERVILEVLPIVEDLVAATPSDVGDATSVDVRVAVDGRVVGGTVGGVHGDVLLATTYSRLGPKHRLAAWVRLLALTAADPSRAWSARTIGRAPRGDGIAVAALPPLGPAAHGYLERLVDLYTRALLEPPPLYCATSAAWAAAVHAGTDPLRAACREWESGFDFDREDREPEHLLVLGGQLPFAELRRRPPRDDEHGDGWDPTEPSRVGRWARRLWDHLLDAEQLA